MKRFSKLIENINIEKTYKIKAEVEFTIKAENTGEAGYIADSELSSMADEYTIIDISEIQDISIQIKKNNIDKL
jgi:hypothetical protein